MCRWGQSFNRPHAQEPPCIQRQKLVLGQQSSLTYEQKCDIPVHPFCSSHQDVAGADHQIDSQAERNLQWVTPLFGGTPLAIYEVIAGYTCAYICSIILGTASRLVIALAVVRRVPLTRCAFWITQLCGGTPLALDEVIAGATCG